MLDSTLVGRRFKLTAFSSILLLGTVGTEVSSLVAQESGVVFVEGDQVGIGTAAPQARLEVEDGEVTPVQPVVLLHNPVGPPRLEQRNGAGGHTWRQSVTAQGFYNVDDTRDGIIELSLSQTGDLTISGNIITTNCPAGCGPDYVFHPEYELMSLGELKEFVERNRHLPKIPPAVEMEKNGIDMTKLQLQMLEKLEELTLYTLQQEETIMRQQEVVRRHQQTINALRGEVHALLHSFEGDRAKNDRSKELQPGSR